MHQGLCKLSKRKSHSHTCHRVDESAASHNHSSVPRKITSSRLALCKEKPDCGFLRFEPVGKYFWDCQTGQQSAWGKGLKLRHIANCSTDQRRSSYHRAVARPLHAPRISALDKARQRLDGRIDLERRGHRCKIQAKTLVRKLLTRRCITC